jgi:hypothetical protein
MSMREYSFMQISQWGEQLFKSNSFQILQKTFNCHDNINEVILRIGFCIGVIFEINLNNI